MTGHFARPSLEETLDAIVGHDIFHVQFNMSSTHLKEPLAEGVGAVCEQVRKQIARRNMIISALSGEVNMVHPDPAARQAEIRRLELLISACERLGTSTIATCTGSRSAASMWRNHPDNATEEAWQVLHNTLDQLLPIAEKHGVTLAFEPEVNNVANTVRKSRRLIEEMGSPNLKVVMDAANIFGEGELPRMNEILDEAFDLLGDHIAIAHAKDLDHDGDAGHLAAGTGLLDYERYVSLLCDLPFDVPVILHGLSEGQVDGCVAMLNGLAKSSGVGANSRRRSGTCQRSES